MRFKIEDIIFWILIFAAVAVILWLLKGSPTLESATISIGLFIIGSELLLWRKIFEIGKDTAISLARLDKNVTISFEKLKNDVRNLNNGQKEIKRELINIKKINN